MHPGRLLLVCASNEPVCNSAADNQSYMTTSLRHINFKMMKLQESEIQNNQPITGYLQGVSPHWTPGNLAKCQALYKHELDT